MTSPIDEARIQAHLVLRRAGLALDCPTEPKLEAIRFRPDGKGGEVASPFPMAAGLESQAVAEQCLDPGWFESIRPSGGWIAFDLSEQWRDYIRLWRPQSIPQDLCVPDRPDFPAHINAASWRFCALLGQARPQLAARLDLSNPYRRVARALKLAGQGAGNRRRDRYLINLCAQVDSAKTLLTLADAYLAHPGEDDTVQKMLRHGKNILGI